MTNLLTLLGKLPLAAIEAFKRDTASFSSRHVYFGLVAALGFPLYYLIWHDLFPQPYQNLPLRLAGSLMFIPIVFSSSWPDSLKRFFVAYWYLALLFALPFFFTYMLLQNDVSTVWLLSTLVALFVMILLLDTINLLVHIIVGVSSAVLAFNLTSEFGVSSIIASVEYIPIFLFAIAMGIIVNYSGEKLRAERQHAMLATAAMVAHELRTPLLSVKTGASGVQKHLPILLGAYRSAVDHKLIAGSIRAAHLESMAGVLDRIEAEADRSNTVIDMLLYTIRGTGMQDKDFIACSMARCVETAVRRYPFNSDRERGLVHWEQGTDFSFLGAEMLMVHVIFNLMKNALHHIAASGKGVITIRLEAGEEVSRLIFRDTGPGIPAEVLPHIFRRYYSWPTHGEGTIEATGVGLSFCREVVEAFGGTIECRSRVNAYTEFTITFPGSLTPA